MSCDEERRPVAKFMRESIVFCSTCIRCRRKESSRSLSHLLMSFLFKITRPVHNAPARKFNNFATPADHNAPKCSKIRQSAAELSHVSSGFGSWNVFIARWTLGLYRHWSTPLSHRASTIVTLFCLPRRRRSSTSCSMFKMLQHVWSQGPGNTSVVCLGWCMTTCTGWLFLSECSTSCCDSPSLCSPANCRLLCASLRSC